MIIQPVLIGLEAQKKHMKILSHKEGESELNVIDMSYVEITHIEASKHGTTLSDISGIRFDISRNTTFDLSNVRNPYSFFSI